MCAGVREVETIGGPGRAVNVWLDPGRLRERGIDVPRLQATLAAANQAMPAGAVLDDAQTAPRMLTVETGEFLRSAAEVGELVVGVRRRQAGVPARSRAHRGRRAAAAALRLVHARRGQRSARCRQRAARR